MINPIVSTNWLKNELDHQNLILLDASPKAKVTGDESEYKGIQIPSARGFNLKKNFSDLASEMPNTLPGAKQFETECRKLGINKESIIIVYDNLGIYSSPRVWWMFKSMGHQNVAVLNGGLPEWIKDGYPIEDKKEETFALGNFEAKLNPSKVKSYEEVLKNTSANNFLVIDARSSGRYNGTAPEPRPQLKSGHIPHSINIPYPSVLSNGKFKSEPELRTLFDSKIKNEQDLTFSCGSGLTACIVLLAHELAYDKNTSIYDGSWTEWAELQHLKL